MARRTVLICDGCNSVLLEETDGFLIRGDIFTGVTESPKLLVGPSSADTGETAFCENCLLKALGLGK